MKENFRNHLMDMMTGTASYAVEVTMYLATRGVGRHIRGGWCGAEK